MNILGKIFSSGATELVKGVGGVIDNLHTSKEEKLAAEQKIQELIASYETQMEKEISTRWAADMASDSWLSKNVRPLVLVWCIVVFSFAGILDSIDTIPFNIHETWNDTFEKVMMAVVLAYFGGRSSEKAVSIFKK